MIGHKKFGIEFNYIF